MEESAHGRAGGETQDWTVFGFLSFSFGNRGFLIFACPTCLFWVPSPAEMAHLISVDYFRHSVAQGNEIEFFGCHASARDFSPLIHPTRWRSASFGSVISFS